MLNSLNRKELLGVTAQGNHNFGTTSHCRVPLKSRAGQLRITPDVQIGCISCASTDGRFGGPVWCGAMPVRLRVHLYIVCMHTHVLGCFV